MADAGPFVSRGGLKLAAALDAFNFDVAGLACADLGCNVGGFTDCLLQRGAAHVYSVDTAYGTFDWRLRNDPRVTLLERTNVLHIDPATVEGFTGCDVVVIDLGWTRQSRALPAAMRWLAPSPDARIITLIKPQYEAPSQALSELEESPRRVRSRHQKGAGVLDDESAARIVADTLAAMTALSLRVCADTPSPIRGGGSRGRGREGNREHLALLARA